MSVMDQESIHVTARTRTGVKDKAQITSEFKDRDRVKRQGMRVKVRGD